MTNCARMAAILLLFPLSAAAQKRDGAQNNSQERPENAAEPKAPASAKDSNYIIRADDVLDIRVFKEPDLSLNSVKVRPDGKISVPLLNDIQAEGLTPVQLGASIAALLRKYLTEPKVTVIVIQNTGQRVYVVGEVSRPGPVNLLPGMTIVQALAMAGGFTEYANRKATYVLRTENGKSTILRFNYKKAIRGDVSENISLKDGDTVVIP